MIIEVNKAKNGFVAQIENQFVVADTLGALFNRVKLLIEEQEKLTNKEVGTKIAIRNKKDLNS